MLTEDTFKKLRSLKLLVRIRQITLKNHHTIKAGMAWKQSMWLKTFRLVQSTRKVFTGAMLLSIYYDIMLKMALKTSKKQGRTLIG